MSEQTNSIWAASCSPMTVKKPWKNSMVRSLPTQSKRVSPLVDLVDQGQVFVAFGVLDFIHTNGADRLQGAMLQAPADHILDGVAHLVPGSVERIGSFLPGELPRPAGQKQHIGSGQLVLTIAPGNLLDHHATIPAVDPSH